MKRILLVVVLVTGFVSNTMALTNKVLIIGIDGTADPQHL
jgi:hypothetical protein